MSRPWQQRSTQRIDMTLGPMLVALGADDSPTGYAGGIERKLALRRLETAGEPVSAGGSA